MVVWRACKQWKEPQQVEKPGSDWAPPPQTHTHLDEVDQLVAGLVVVDATPHHLLAHVQVDLARGAAHVAAKGANGGQAGRAGSAANGVPGHRSEVRGAGLQRGPASDRAAWQARAGAAGCQHPGDPISPKIGVGHLSRAVDNAAHDGDGHARQVAGLLPNLVGHLLR